MEIEAGFIRSWLRQDLESLHYAVCWCFTLSGFVRDIWLQSEGLNSADQVHDFIISHPSLSQHHQSFYPKVKIGKVPPHLSPVKEIYPNWSLLVATFWGRDLRGLWPLVRGLQSCTLHLVAPHKHKSFIPTHGCRGNFESKDLASKVSMLSCKKVKAWWTRLPHFQGSCEPFMRPAIRNGHSLSGAFPMTKRMSVDYELIGQKHQKQQNKHVLALLHSFWAKFGTCPASGWSRQPGCCTRARPTTTPWHLAAGCSVKLSLESWEFHANYHSTLHRQLSELLRRDAKIWGLVCTTTWAKLVPASTSWAWHCCPDFCRHYTTESEGQPLGVWKCRGSFQGTRGCLSQACQAGFRFRALLTWQRHGPDVIFCKLSGVQRQMNELQELWRIQNTIESERSAQTFANITCS